MMISVLFAGLRARKADLCTKFAECRAELRIARHERNAKLAELDALHACLDARRHVFGMIEAFISALLTSHDTCLTCLYAGFVVRIHGFPYQLVLIAKTGNLALQT